MTKTEQATKNMELLCTDNSHGYDQAHRWGPDYDCSSAVITAWQDAGVPVKSSGASYTGNMYSVFLSCGFKDVTSQVNLATGAGLQRGDVLLNHRSHTAMFVGYGTLAQASQNENGGTTGGQTGDQTGMEIRLRSYYNFPWDVVLRFVDSTPEPTPEPAPEPEPAGETCEVKTTMAVLRPDPMHNSFDVKQAQERLIYKGFTPQYGADGYFGPATQSAVERFQKANNIPVTGIIDSQTWAKLLEAR